MDFSRDFFLKELEASNPEYKEAIVQYTDNLLQKGLPVIFSLKHFSGIIGIDLLELKQIIMNTDGFYAYFLIKKKNGGKRRIVAPYQNLKRIQKWILHEILDKVVVHPQSKGFSKGTNTLQNARPHIGKKFIRKFDLKDFFESITIERVYGIFQELGYSPAVSHDLASFCCLKLSDERYDRMSNYQRNWFGDLHDRTSAVLAQGAPTSPALANIVCRHLDGRLFKYAMVNDSQYTRYADDLTFSSDDISKLPNISFIRKLLKGEQLYLNDSKTGTFGRESRQMVTGVLIDGDKARVPQKFKRQIYRHLHFCQKFGTKSHFDNVMPGYAHARQWLYGKIMYVNAIEPEEAKKMFAIADSLEWGLN